MNRKQQLMNNEEEQLKRKREKTLEKKDKEKMPRMKLRGERKI